MYKIQTTKYNDSAGWEDVAGEERWISNKEDLSEWVLYIYGMETHDKYSFRIVDETGKVFATRTIPYEGVSIDLENSPAIRKDYNISKVNWFFACLSWMVNNAERV